MPNAGCCGGGAGGSREGKFLNLDGESGGIPVTGVIIDTSSLDADGLAVVVTSSPSGRLFFLLVNNPELLLVFFGGAADGRGRVVEGGRRAGAVSRRFLRSGLKRNLPIVLLLVAVMDHMMRGSVLNSIDVE